MTPSAPTPRYENPPLLEAVLGFRFARAPRSWDSVYFGKLHLALKGFPRVDTLEGASLTFQPGQGVQFTPAPEVKRFIREDGGVVVSASPETVGVSVLPKQIAGGHPGWDFLRDTALWALQAYESITSPGPLQEVGVRYIDVVPIDPGSFRLGDFVRAESGIVPMALMDERNPFAFRVERTSGTEYGNLREVVSMQARATATGGGELVLDVDELMQVRSEAATPNVETLADHLHEAVHRVFGSVIHESVLRSFNPLPAEANAR
ncbi:TIGR04255 family protein [Roseisolibacter agri]|uniref:TIGR04255 family protein n=1 Tax=Roseisolibacter agri TaxID=2014610 RepID=A0AA37VBE6_9BACT|nr:TIGR04255 family protein [Roseisolibacter agri]GLC26353.1 hypothetical protein rosag_28660 [Roseisolibacter agri]